MGQWIGLGVLAALLSGGAQTDQPEPMRPPISESALIAATDSEPIPLTETVAQNLELEIAATKDESAATPEPTPTPQPKPEVKPQPAPEPEPKPVATPAPEPPSQPTEKEKPAHTYLGVATWYRHGDGMNTASRDFPQGTKLRVVAVNSGKSVDVIVNDYGPALHTGVALDLNAPAFSALAPLGAGKIFIEYYPI